MWCRFLARPPVLAVRARRRLLAAAAAGAGGAAAVGPSGAGSLGLVAQSALRRRHSRPGWEVRRAERRVRGRAHAVEAVAWHTRVDARRAARCARSVGAGAAAVQSRLAGADAGVAGQSRGGGGDHRGGVRSNRADEGVRRGGGVARGASHGVDLTLAAAAAAAGLHADECSVFYGCLLGRWVPNNRLCLWRRKCRARWEGRARGRGRPEGVK